MSVANLRTGIAGQLMIATNALHDPRTRVEPNTALEFESEAVADDLPLLRKQGIAGTLGPRSGRVRPIDTGHGNGTSVHTLLNNGFARLLRHCFAGYQFSWPGSTDASQTLTLAALPATGETMTIGAQTYTFRTTLTASTTADEILIASTIALQTSYIEAAINRTVASDGQGSGFAYGSLTPRNADVSAVSDPTTVTVTDRQARGSGGNTVATTETFADVGNVWGGATLTGGVDGTDTARLHTFTLDATRLLELMATLQIVRPTVIAARVAFDYISKVVSTNIAAADGDALMLTPTWDSLARDTTQAPGTPVYPATATFFDYTQIAVEIDTVFEPVQGINLDINTAQEARTQFGQSTLLDHLITDRPSITGELTHEFRSSALFNDWIAGVEAALVIQSTGGLIPGSASNYQTTITAADIIYTGSTPQVGGPGVVQQNIPFEVLDNGVDDWIKVEYLTDEGFVGDDG